MTENTISEVTKEHIESELDAAVQCAGLQVCQLTSAMAAAIQQAIVAYQLKLSEEISKCKTMHEVHDLLGMNAIGAMMVQQSARVPSEDE